MTEKPWADIHWQPIESLSLIRSMVDGLLDETEKQYANLESCRSKPHVLDDYTVDRVIKVYTDQAGDLRLYEEQLWRWKKLELDRFQRPEVERLAAQVPRCRPALKTRISALYLSTVFRDLTTLSLHLIPGFVYLNPGRSYA